MASKIALHVLTPSPAIDALIRSAPFAAVKAVGNPAPLAVAARAGIAVRILRQYGVETMDPAGAVAAIAAHDLSQVTHLQLCCEDAKGYDPAWQLAVMDGLRARGYTGRYLLCGAATGNPPKIVGDPPHFPELEPLYDLLRRPDVDLALDAYTGLLVMDPRWAAWAPYTVFRPTLIRADLARQGIPVNVVVTESGGDNIAPVTTGGGWQTRNWSADEYLKTLLAVDADDQLHPWLLARCLFTSGPTPDWWAFDLAPVAGQLAAYVATQAGTPPQSPQDTPTAPATTKGAPMAGYSKATWVPSPNYFPGRHGMAVTTVVLHGTAGPGAVSWFQNPASQVSAHYVVGEDSSVTQCVDETDSAWHAGVVTPDSAYAGGPNPNYFSIGIEHERSVGNDNPMPEAQIRASLALVADLLRRYGPLTLVTHDRIDVGRVCPGPGFPLARFLALLQPAPAPVPVPTPTPAAQGVEAVITITPAVRAAAVDRYAALGIQPLQQGAIFAEFLARYAVGQANPTHNAILPTPALTPEVTPDASGDAYALFDDGSIWVWRKAKGAVYLLEEKDRAAAMKLCGWGGRFA